MTEFAWLCVLTAPIGAMFIFLIWDARNDKARVDRIINRIDFDRRVLLMLLDYEKQKGVKHDKNN